MKPFRRFCSGVRRESALILGRKKSARIYITAKHFVDGVWTLALMHRYMKRAERTAKLMRKVGTMAFDATWDWEQIKYCLEDLGLGPVADGQPGNESASRPSEEAVVCNEDR